MPHNDARCDEADPLTTREGGKKKKIRNMEKKKNVFPSRWRMECGAVLRRLPSEAPIDWPWVLIKVAPDSKADREQFQRHLSLWSRTGGESENRESAKRMVQDGGTELVVPLRVNHPPFSRVPFRWLQVNATGELSWPSKREDTLE